jgi:hypothetical protein
VIEEPRALFHRDGDHFVPGELTRGGWGDHTQHGGPPTGLLAHVIEYRHLKPGMMVTRLTTDLLRPVPLTPLTVRTKVVRPGRRIELLEAAIEAGGVEVARGLALAVRLGEVDLPATGTVDGPLPPPEDVDPMTQWSWADEQAHLPRFHTDAIEIRSVDHSFVRAGRGLSWFRLDAPVVAGVATSPFVLAAVLADLGNGNSSALDPREWLFINPDVNLALHRLPAGEWIGMDSTVHQHSTGIGLAQSILYDRTGPIGTVGQSQIIERHR